MRNSFTAIRCIDCKGSLEAHATDVAAGRHDFAMGFLICTNCCRTYLVKDGVPRMCRPSHGELEDFRARGIDGLRVDAPDSSATHRENFDRLYETYGELADHKALDERKANVPLARRSTEVQLAAICDAIPTWTGATILDCGCGFGFDLELYATKAPGAAFYGVDVSAVMLQRIVKHGIPATVALAFAEALPFSDNFFDFVASHEVIEHVVDKRRALDELARVLKPGGKAVITTPNAGSLWARALEPLLNYRKGEDSMLEYDVPIPRTEMTGLTGQCGLEVERWDYTCPFYLTLTRLTPRLRAFNARLASLATGVVLAAYPLVPRVPGLRALLCEQVTVVLRKSE